MDYTTTSGGGSLGNVPAPYLTTIDNFLTPNPLANPSSGAEFAHAGEAYLKFAASKIMKQPRRFDDSSLRDSEEEVFQSVRGRGLVGTVQVPHQCDMRAGHGEFLLIGRMKFGAPVLQCIPKLDQFINLAEENKNTSYCSIRL